MKKIRILAILSAVVLLVGCSASNAVGSAQEYQGLLLPTTEEMQNMNSREKLFTPGGANDLADGGAIYAYRELAEEKGLTNYKRTTEEKEQDAREEEENKNKSTEISQTESFPEYAILSEKYFFIQALYQKAVEEYLGEMLDLAEIDREIANDKHEFYPDEEAYLNYYKSHSMLGCTYIYLRNTASVERLSQEDIDTLLRYYDKQETEITQELGEMVERTYAYILAPVDTQKSDSKYVSYDLGREQNFSVDTIVFGISIENPYDEKGENQLVEDEKYEEDCLYLTETLVPKFEKKLADKLGKGSTVAFIVYD